MEVLFISYKYPPSIGGMQKQSYELINGYAKMEKSFSIIYDHKTPLVYFFVSLFWKVPILLKKHPSIKIIHFNDGVCAICCAWMKIFKSKALVVTYHGLDLVFPSKFYQTILLPIIRSFDRIITVSHHTKLECIRRGFDPNKIKVINNGVDPMPSINHSNINPSLLEKLRLLEKANKKIITAIGRPVKRKGFVWFVKEVVSRLDDEYVFILIGPAPKYSKLKQRILKSLPKSIYNQVVLLFGLSTENEELYDLQIQNTFRNKFIWLDQLDHNSKLHLLQQASLMVMPNVKVEGDMEGFGLVALEANVLNTPVIASRLEGITCAVKNNKNGWLIESENSDVWLTSIKAFFSKKQFFHCQKFVLDNYSWHKMVLGYKNVFHSI